MRQIIFVKYNRTRTAEFQLKTEIVQEDGKRSVEKSALSEAGREHIRSFQEKYEKIRGQNPRIRFLAPEFADDGRTVRFPYLSGKTLGDALGEEIHMGQAPYEALEEAMALAFPEDFCTKNSGESLCPGAADQTGAAVKTVENGGASWITPEFQRVFGALPEEFAVRGRLISPANVDGLFEN